MGKPVTINKEDELIKDCPKAIAKLKAWLAKELQEVPDSAEADILVVMILRYNTRILYDFFDDNKIYAEVTVNLMGPEFTSVVNQNHSKSYSSRAEAEEAGFKEAFKIMEQNENNP